MERISGPITAEPIRRYDVDQDGCDYPAPDGEFVRYANVEPILRNWPAVLVALSGCRDALKLAMDSDDFRAGETETATQMQQAYNSAILALAEVNRKP